MGRFKLKEKLYEEKNVILKKTAMILVELLGYQIKVEITHCVG